MMAVKSESFGIARPCYNLSSQANLDHSRRGQSSNLSEPMDTFCSLTTRPTRSGAYDSTESKPLKRGQLLNGVLFWHSYWLAFATPLKRN